MLINHVILFAPPAVLLYLTVRTVHWTRGRRGASSEAGRRCGEPQERRQVYSLLAGTAAIAIFFRGWHRTLAADALYSLLAWLTPRTQPWHSRNTPPLSRWSSHACVLHTARDQASTSWRACAVLDYKWSQLLQPLFIKWEESLNTPPWPICSLPTNAFCVIVCLLLGMRKAKQKKGIRDKNAG